jgi:hypothetical protein
MKSFVASAIALTADTNGGGCCLITLALLQMSFHRDRVILAVVAVGRLLEHNKERDHR